MSSKKRKNCESSSGGTAANASTPQRDNIVVIDESLLSDSKSSHSLTKKEAKAKRIQDNKEWKCKKNWGDEDPNPRHSLYYSAQFPDVEADEWRDFRNTISQELPVTFRIGHVASSTKALQYLLRNALQNIKRAKGRFIQVKDVVISSSDIISNVPWMEDTWQLAADGSSLSKEISLTFLKDMLHNYVTNGLIIRQELVSMIPAALLDVKPWHTVIDMCAAPGSKTSQLLQIMTEQCTADNGGKRDGTQGPVFPTGVVIANDADPKRIETLRNRFAHAAHPSLIFTCSRAEDLVRRLIDSHISVDRIICDVPCSGDGTFRKSPHLWRLFRPRSALELHPLQLQLAISGCSVLRPGGRMVYSTCSLNPIEDEAVVLGLLRHYKGKIRIIDIRNDSSVSSSSSSSTTEDILKLLPKLKSRPGLTTWRCSSDVFAVGEDGESGKKKSISMLPPIISSMHPPNLSERGEYNLEHCLRIMPHDQNTGGFFIAVLEKVAADEDDEEEDVKGAVMSKFVDIIDNSQAMEVMKKLGYNPKKSQNPDRSYNNSNSNSNKISSSTTLDLIQDGLLESYFDFFNRSGGLCTSVQESDVDKYASDLEVPIASSTQPRDKAKDKVALSNSSMITGDARNPKFKNLYMQDSLNPSKSSSSSSSSSESGFIVGTKQHIYEVRAISQGVRDLLNKDDLTGLKDPRVGLLVGAVASSDNGNSSRSSMGGGSSGSEFAIVNLCADNVPLLSSLIKPENLVKVDLQLFCTMLSTLIDMSSEGDASNALLKIRRSNRSASLKKEGSYGLPPPLDSSGIPIIDLPDLAFDSLMNLMKLDTLSGGGRHAFIGVRSIFADGSNSHNSHNNSHSSSSSSSSSSSISSSSSNHFGRCSMKQDDDNKDPEPNAADDIESNENNDGKRRRLSKAEKKKMKSGLTSASATSTSRGPTSLDADAKKVSTMSFGSNKNSTCDFEGLVIAFELSNSVDPRANSSSSSSSSSSMITCHADQGDSSEEVVLNLISSIETCRSFQQLLIALK